MKWIYSDRRAMAYIAQLTHSSVTEDATFVAEMDGDEVKAVAIFDHYVKRSITTHSWFVPGYHPSRAFWLAIHDYVFNQLKVTNVIGPVPSSNKAAIKLNEHMGYKLVATVPNYYENGDDQLIYVGLEENARPFWHKYQQNQRKAA